MGKKLVTKAVMARLAGMARRLDASEAYLRGKYPCDVVLKGSTRAMDLRDAETLRAVIKALEAVALGGANENAQGHMKTNPPAAGRGEGDSHG